MSNVIQLRASTELPRAPAEPNRLQADVAEARRRVASRGFQVYGLKYYPRLGYWKAANNWFDPASCTAKSYGWWVYVKRLPDGRVLFNSYSYSISTSKHQTRMRSLLRHLGIQIDIKVEAPGGLQDLKSAISLYERRIARLEAEIATPRSHAAKNAERHEQIGATLAKIVEVTQLLKLQSGEVV